ncbi:MAG: YlxM family DNA-binding protein [Eubacteriales bacterium]|nr:YlxM family DNA-binding protein [Eubacteriales bacterium]
MDKRFRMVWLTDIYGPLLTEKQREALTKYYDEDFSLSEIAKDFGSSRQAVSDLIKRSEAVIEDYEEKLGLYEKFTENSALLDELAKFAAGNREAMAIIWKLKENI